MKMSIARALKERKRIIGEMNTCWNRILENNCVQRNVKAVDGKFIQPPREELAKFRKQDPKKLRETWDKLEARLIALKVALHKANTDAAELLAKLSERKAELKLLECMPSFINTSEYYNTDFMKVYDVVFDSTWQTSRIDAVRKEINELQDAIDEYNATHYIELED